MKLFKTNMREIYCQLPSQSHAIQYTRCTKTKRPSVYFSNNFVKI